MWIVSGIAGWDHLLTINITHITLHQYRLVFSCSEDKISQRQHAFLGECTKELNMVAEVGFEDDKTPTGWFNTLNAIVFSLA